MLGTDRPTGPGDSFPGGGPSDGCLPRCLSSALGDECQEERNRGKAQFPPGAEAEEIGDLAIATCENLCRKSTSADSTPCAYLSRSIQNAATRAWQRRGSQGARRWRDFEQSRACPSRDAENDIADAQLQRILHEEGELLEPKDREVLSLWLDGLDDKEIADHLGKPSADAARKARTRALGRLQARMRNRCPDLDLPDL